MWKLQGYVVAYDEVLCCVLCMTDDMYKANQLAYNAVDILMQLQACVCM